MKVNNTPRARTLQRNADIKASSIIAACAGWVMLCAVSLATHTQRHTAVGVCVTAFAMWLRSQRSAAYVSASHPRSSTSFGRRHEQRSEFGRYSLAAVCHPPACVCASHGSRTEANAVAQLRAIIAPPDVTHFVTHSRCAAIHTLWHVVAALHDRVRSTCFFLLTLRRLLRACVNISVRCAAYAAIA